MPDWKSLSNVRWDCKYHVVIVPKYHKKKLYGKFRDEVGQIIKELCRQKGKSAVRIHREVLRIKRVTSLHFWSRENCVSTVGLDEETILKYIREQEKREKDQLDIDFDK